MRTAAIIVAAGSGVRFGASTAKQWLMLAGRPVIRHSVDLFARRLEIDRIVVAHPAGRRDDAVSALGGAEAILVEGGATRTQSVRAGLAALSGDPPDRVLIHDAARPLATDALVARLLAALEEADAAAPVLALSDAVKRKADGALGEDVDRDGLLAVQTPQAFRFAAIARAYEAISAGSSLPDDVAVARAAGISTAAVAGDPRNIKLTHAEDLPLMESLLNPAPGAETVTGQGFDAHRLIPGGGLTLCGVSIPCEFALAGHSDADAGLHAICDAMLGTIGAGDIGRHFPPGDPQWKDADSAAFVGRCLALMRDAGAAPVHCDVTLICERPRIGPHRDAMQARIAALLALPEARINVKATTTEGMGFAGRGEGVAAQAVVTARIAARHV